MSYLQTRFAGLVSYGLSADLLNEILPLGRAWHRPRFIIKAMRDGLQERPGFITGRPADWAELPRPDLSLVVGLERRSVHFLDALDPAVTAGSR